MNREIKFRCWVVNDSIKEMHYPNEIDMNSAAANALWHKVGFENANPEKRIISDWQKEIIWMQYTGLKDKNGKEIYEGDVLLQKTTEHFKQFNDSVWEHKYIVEFGEYDWRPSEDGYKTVGFYLKGTSTSNKGINQYSLLDENYPFEIIGNLYENPELLTN